MNKPAIVTIAYNRPDSLRRLLKSIGNARYEGNVNIPLVISIDNSGEDSVLKVAEAFEWKQGEKIILARKERMGLKAHVLACGDLAEEYGSIIVLEDDLYVSPLFYEYAVAALDFTEGDERIGGVSLYNHLFNVHARKSFAAVDDGYDNWYFQLASSWGQAYTKGQWTAFKKWYEEHKDEPISGAMVPANVASWSEKSWLKFYITYLIKTDKYFIYPRISYTTNFGDVGSHAVKADADLQVPLAGFGNAGMKYAKATANEKNESAVQMESNAGKIANRFDFSRLEESGAIYDAFFENVRLQSMDCDRSNEICACDSIDNMQVDEASDNKAENKSKNRPENKPDQSLTYGEVIIDLYGKKPIKEMAEERSGYKYALSSQCLPYKVVRTYGRQMRPEDANILYGVIGEDYFLYDLSITGEAPKNGNPAIEYLYEYRGISAKQMLEIIKYRIRESLKR